MYFPLDVYPKMSQWKNCTHTELSNKKKRKKKDLPSKIKSTWDMSYLEHAASQGWIQRGGMILGVRTPNFINNEKTLRMSVRKHHVLVVYSYPGKVSDSPLWA